MCTSNPNMLWAMYDPLVKGEPLLTWQVQKTSKGTLNQHGT